MRVLLDTNVLISYPLPPASSSPPIAIVEAAFTGAHTLLLPAEVLDELTDRVMAKPYLAQRIELDDLSGFVEALAAVAEALPTIEQTIPAVSRDRQDDYLLAYAIVGQADYLVTGDRDLLSLGEIAGVTILAPAAFLTVLHSREEPGAG